MEKNRRKIGIVVLLLMTAVLISFCLMGCSSNYVSEKNILEDLKKEETLSAHSIEIEEFKIIKRLSDEEQDNVFVNVKGENSIYSVSLNYKMVYLPYNEGWLLETVEQYEDTEGFVNEIMPLQGPTQEDIDSFASTVNWGEFCSYDNRYVKETKWEIIDTGALELENDYGRAEYNCKIVYKYDYMEEVVIFPVVFNFGDVYSNGARGWYGFGETTKDTIKRKLKLTEDICGEWHSELTSTQSSGLSYKIDFKITSVWENPQNEISFCDVEDYTVYSNGEKCSSRGTMQLSPTINKSTGKITGLSLTWTDGQHNHPKECTPITLSNSYFLVGKLNSLTLTHERYGYHNVLVLTQK